MLRRIGITFRSAFLWAGGWIVFLLGAVIVVPATFFLSGPRLYRMIQPWCRLLLRAVGIRVELAGEFPELSGKPTILIVPHVSVFDPVVIGAVMPYHVPGVELDTHFPWPLYGRIIRALRHFPLSHSTPLKSRETLRAAEDHLQAGGSLVVFPEGRRTRSGQRGEFGLWTFRLAATAEATVYPIRFEGAYERHRTEGFDIIPGVWRVRILEPQRAMGSDRTATIALRDSVARSIDTH